MGRILDLAKSVASEVSLWGRLGYWIINLSEAEERVESRATVLETDVNTLESDVATLDVRVDALEAGSSGGQLLPFVAATMTWAEVIGIVNANANRLPVLFLPGTYTVNASIPLASGAHLFMSPGVILNNTQGIVGFSTFTFFQLGTLGVGGTLAATPTVGSATISSTVNFAIGTRIAIGQTPATGHDFLAAQYEIRASAGAGPFTLTLDRALRLPFIMGDEVRPYTAQPQNIIIEGNGATMTGSADRAVEFTHALNCHVRGLRWPPAANYSTGVSFDVGSLDCTIEDCIASSGCLFGFLLESSERCVIKRCQSDDGTNAITLFDSADCSVEDSGGSRNINAGVVVTSNLMTVGCFDCHVRNCWGTRGANIGLAIGFATDCLFECFDADGNLDGIDTGLNCVRGQFIGCHTARNTAAGTRVRSAGATFTNHASLSDLRAMFALQGFDATGFVLKNYTGTGVLVDPAIPAGSRINLTSGRIESNISGSIGCDINGAGSPVVRFAAVHFFNDSVAANQNAIFHRTGATPGIVILKECTAAQSSASNGYFGFAGATLRTEGRVDFTALTVPITINAAGFSNVGNVVANGTGAAQAVAFPDVKADPLDPITITRIVTAGTPAIAPLIAKVAGVGFNFTAPAADTSTYQFRIG